MAVGSADAKSPDDRLQEAMDESDESVARDLLDAIAQE